MSMEFASPRGKDLAYLRDVADETGGLLDNLSEGKLLEDGPDIAARLPDTQIDCYRRRAKATCHLHNLLQLLNPEQRPINTVWPVAWGEGRWPFMSLQTLGSAVCNLLAQWGLSEAIGAVGTSRKWTPVMPDDLLGKLGRTRDELLRNANIPGVHLIELHRLTTVLPETVELLERGLSELRQVIAEASSGAPDPSVDDSAFRPAKEFLATPFDTYKEIKRVLKDNPWIRHRKPSANRLEIHAGDWLKFRSNQTADPPDSEAAIVDAVLETERAKQEIKKNTAGK
jgi:hypothetical protein